MPDRLDKLLSSVISLVVAAMRAFVFAHFFHDELAVNHSKQRLSWLG
jgi:hypothetical protein